MIHLFQKFWHMPIGPDLDRTFQEIAEQSKQVLADKNVNVEKYYLII